MEKDKQVVTIGHPDFGMLMYAIDKEMQINDGCNHTHENFDKACKRLEDFKGFEIDRDKTLKWMESNGGHCDCEILMNAQFAEPEPEFEAHLNEVEIMRLLDKIVEYKQLIDWIIENFGSIKTSDFASKEEYGKLIPVETTLEELIRISLSEIEPESPDNLPF